MTDKPERLEALPLSQNSTGSGLIVTTLALLALGVVMVHSALAGVQAGWTVWYARADMRHALFAVAATVVLCVGWRFKYRWLAGSSRWPTVAAMLLAAAIVCAVLVYVPGLGHRVNGKLRWLRFGPRQYGIGFQPSELLKLTLVMFMAAWLSRRWVDVRSLPKTVLPAATLMVGCLALVVTQDLGTAIMTGLAVLVTLFMAGVPWYWLACMAGAAGAGFWHFVADSPTRLARIQAMINPWCQSNPSAYQPRQSLLAILTGGWTGKGLGSGINKLGFVPEDSTDFIFAIFAEEWGLVGAILLMGLVVVWMWFVRRAAVRAGDRFGQLLAGSLGALIAMQMVLHIAVDLVAAPPTGVSFPFVSAGGTALVMMAGAVALIVSVSAHGRGDVAGEAGDRHAVTE
ncbi:MAG: FtsW/RodA/SpoVE family cell cycle protein [Alphaproteobacteria bacterium]|nr:FtsW/RodA/SpoVE family cell cycle protein [Alphaproteobacteria bacterium]